MAKRVSPEQRVCGYVDRRIRLDIARGFSTYKRTIARRRIR